MRVREEMSTETAVRDPKWNPIKGDAFEKGHIRREVEGAHAAPLDTMGNRLYALRLCGAARYRRAGVTGIVTSVRFLNQFRQSGPPRPLW